MARIGINEVEKYTANKSTGWFSLKDHGDSATIRFMYKDPTELFLNTVHEIEVDGKKRYVNCLRQSGESADTCPLCRAGEKASIKMFVPVWDEKEKEVKIWTRGRSFAGQLSSYAQRYNPLCSVPFDVERQGHKGDTGTTYLFYPGMPDNKSLEDLGERPQIDGGLVLDKTFEELDNYVKAGSFEPNEVRPRGGF